MDVGELTMFWFGLEMAAGRCPEPSAGTRMYIMRYLKPMIHALNVLLRLSVFSCRVFLGGGDPELPLNYP